HSDRHFEVGLQRGHTGGFRGAPGQRVLHNAVLDVPAAKLAAQLLDLADRQAAIVGEDSDLGLLQLLAEQLDLLGLLFLACSRQIKNPPCQTTLKAGRIRSSFTSECLGRKLSLLALAPTV